MPSCFAVAPRPARALVGEIWPRRPGGPAASLLRRWWRRCSDSGVLGAGAATGWARSPHVRPLLALGCGFLLAAHRGADQLTAGVALSGAHVARRNRFAANPRALRESQRVVLPLRGLPLRQDPMVRHGR